MRGRVAIFVSGPIGAGKTTAARALARHHGVRPWLERYNRNPFLERFYENPRRWVLPSQTFFMLETAVRETCVRVFGGVIDSSMADVHHGFNRSLREMGMMSPGASRAIDVVYRLLGPLRVRPDVVVQLGAPASVLLARIAERGRPMEREITADYLERLGDHMAEHWSAAEPGRVVTLDSGAIDFREPEGEAALMAACRDVIERRGRL